MKIIDCITYFDEPILFDVRTNILNKYVDIFLVIEALHTHSGQKKKLNFNINNYPNFKNKIIYLVIEDEPEDLIKKNYLSSAEKRINSLKRIDQSYNKSIEYLKNSDPENFFILSDSDEIPNLESLNLDNIDKKIILFNQKYYYYKFNLKLNGIKWHGSKACLKKYLISPQWLRNIKDKIYPWWRFDVFFSNKKYKNIKIINNGGWHFSNIKSASEIEKKMRTYLHHREYELNPLGEAKINEIIKEKKPLYNLKSDMKSNKFDLSDRLISANINELPNYVQNNLEKYKKWID